MNSVIWSDVDGMMSTDPREIETARVIEELSYNEVAELAYLGHHSTFADDSAAERATL